MKVGIGEGEQGLLAVLLGELLAVKGEVAEGGVGVGGGESGHEVGEGCEDVGAVGGSGEGGEEGLGFVGAVAVEGEEADAVAEEVDAGVDAGQVVEDSRRGRRPGAVRRCRWCGRGSWSLLTPGQFSETGGRFLSCGKVGSGLLTCGFHSGGGFLAGLLGSVHHSSPSHSPVTSWSYAATDASASGPLNTSARYDSGSTFAKWSSIAATRSGSSVEAWSLRPAW